VLAAEGFARDDPFLVLNSDNYYPVEMLQPLVALDGPGLPVFKRSTLITYSNIDAERISAYAVLTIDAHGNLQDIIEKPDPETLATYGEDFPVSMNCWRFGPSIFTACRSISPSPRGEIELPNAVRHAVRVMGERFRAVPVVAAVLDLSRRADIAEVERRLAHIDPAP
jgi:dTDP-glucose pyrophosphorylase